MKSYFSVCCILLYATKSFNVFYGNIEGITFCDNFQYGYLSTNNFRKHYKGIIHFVLLPIMHLHFSLCQYIIPKVLLEICKRIIKVSQQARIPGHLFYVLHMFSIFSLYCSKIDHLMQERLELLLSWKTVGKPSVLHIMHQALVYMCAKKKKRRIWGCRGALFFFPSTRRCLFLCGAVGFPGVGSAPLR